MRIACIRSQRCGSVADDFPFEKWYAERAPELPVDFVGHPLTDRYPDLEFRDPKSQQRPRKLLLLPGSRAKEISR